MNGAKLKLFVFSFYIFKEVEYYRDWSKKRSEFVWDFFLIKNE